MPRRRARGAGPMRGRTVRTPPYGTRQTSATPTMHGFGCTTGPNGEAVDYKVRLVTTKPNYGGHRWWFICPIVRRDGGPPRRVAKLYLPSGSKYFGSREAYALTYTSCQESGK